MKKILIGLLILGLMCPVVYGASEWSKAEVAGTRNVSDIDAYMAINNEALDRLLSNYKKTVKLKYKSASTIDITSGEITCSNTAGTLRRFRQLPSDLTLTWTNIDTGLEANSTTYYVYGVADSDATTFTGIISINSTTPSGATYYERIGSFYNNSSGNIEQVTNDDTAISISYGTVANGGTISIPSGYSADECSWVIGGNSAIQTDGDGESSSSLTITVNSSRVVTCSSAGTASMSTYGSTCSTNYLIICYR